MLHIFIYNHCYQFEVQLSKDPPKSEVGDKTVVILTGLHKHLKQKWKILPDVRFLT